MNFSYKHIWIIGASTGIGAALARGYSLAGHRVSISARRPELLQDLADQHDKMTVLPLDVEQPQSVFTAVETLHQSGPFPDLIVYCAAIYEPGGLDVLCHERASRQMSVNYLGLIAVLDAVLPILKERGHGHVSVMASLSGYRGLPNAALYGPTKAALINLCETLKPDFERSGLDLSVINPGFVKTPMTDKNSFEMPFLMTADEAARCVMTKLGKGSFEVAFPWPMVWGLKILRLLPYPLYFWLSRKLIP
ncbi:MAG: SDR family NAD(P)-dependent oxidoreductase [Cohaesibacter sp.]|nr:SDR family NAD(P)-dependent oxidoreductase [Cohaesibacter sp.]